MDTKLHLHNARTKASFCVDLANPQDLANFHAIIHELYPERLSSFMHNLSSSHPLRRYPTEIIADVFVRTPKNTEPYRLLGDILRTTFSHARETMHSAWEETMAVFQTVDLEKLTALSAALNNCATNARWKLFSAHDLFSLLGVRTLSLDALDALLRREDPTTPQHPLRATIFRAAKRLIRNLAPGLSVDRERSKELYYRRDLRGNTIAHHIANGTLFPGAKEIIFDPIKDGAILNLTNLAGQTVAKVYHLRLAREMEAQPAALL